MRFRFFSLAVIVLVVMGAGFAANRMNSGTAVTTFEPSIYIDVEQIQSGIEIDALPAAPNDFDMI